MKLPILVLLAAGFGYAQTTNYPGSIDTNTSLFIVSDNVQSPLTVAMTTTDTAAVVKTATGFVPNMLATICDVQDATQKCTAWEHMLITAVNGNVLTVTRAQAGTTARSHTNGKNVSILIDSAHQKVLKDASIAIQTALGANLSNVLGNNPTFAKTVMNNYWSPPPAYYVVAGSVNPPFPNPSISIGFASWMRQNSANGNDAVSVLPSCEVNIAQGVCFGMNIVLGTNGNTSGATQPKLVGIEIDLQSYYPLRSDSYAVSAVNYNVQNPSPAFIVQNGNHGVTPPAWGYGFYSEDGAATTGLYVGAKTFTNGSMSQNVLFHSVDAGGTNLVGELGTDPAGKLILNFPGLYADSKAIKVATAASCTTAGTVGATCTTVINWPSAFANLSYFPLCSITATQGVPYITNEQNVRALGQTSIQIAALTAAAAAGSLNCMAIHY